MEDKGYTLERGDCGTANGYTQPDTRTIRVREDVSDAQAVKTLAHEVAHMLLHTGETGDSLTIQHRGTAEVEAESVAWLIAQVHGLPTEDYTLPYIAAWAGEKGDELIRKTAENVIKTARLVTGLTLAETGPLIPA